MTPPCPLRPKYHRWRAVAGDLIARACDCGARAVIDSQGRTVFQEPKR